MTDTLVSIGPNGIAPPPFPARRYHWVYCDEPGYETFAIHVRHNLTNDERLRFRKAHRDLRDYVNWWTEQFKEWLAEHPNEELPDDHPLNTDTPRMREAAVVAEYVTGWNAMGLTVAPDGEYVETPIPPPAEAGPRVFDLLDEAQRVWIIGRIAAGYLSGKGIRPSSGASKPSPAPSDGPPDPK